MEFWFLLHYRDVASELTSAECVARLRKLDGEYAKGTFSTPMKKMLIENIAYATNRAVAKIPYSNPSSTVHLLTNEILKKM